MSTCSILDRNTKEPKLFYKSDTGVVYSSLYDVLNNTNQSYELGFQDITESFISAATVPVYDRSTQEGRVQHYIKNGYLTGVQTSPNTFEAVDNLAAEILESELILDHYGQYKRNGTTFEFGDFTVDINTLPETFKVQAEAAQILTDKQTQKKERPVRFNPEQLKLMIESFMDKVGFSRTTIENYKRNYKNKFGVEPNAEALIDLQRKIIATINGEITLDQLSEEFSHFVIEAWNQDEIQRMLQTINNTQEYIEHAENYRAIYSKQISDPVLLEQAVRREVLGKMLAVSLQRDFTTENRTDTEVTFFRKLSQIVRDFLNFFRSKVTPTLQQDIDRMAQDIQNRLYNENLEQSLKMDQSPVLTLMYSIDKATEDKIKALTKNIQTTYNSDMEKQVDQVFNTALSTAIASNSKIDNLEDDEVLSPETVAVIETLLDMEDFLTTLLSRFKKLSLKDSVDGKINNIPVERIQRFKNMIVTKGERTMAQITELKGSYKNMRENHDSRIVMEELMKKYENKTDEQIEEILNNAQYGIDQKQADTSWFVKFFMHTGKTSNLFVRQLNLIMASLSNGHKALNVEAIDKFISPLKEYRKKLTEFAKNGFIRSGTDEARRENDRRLYELSILKEVYPDIYDKMTDEEYIEQHQQYSIPELKNIDEKYYEYRYKYDKGLANQKWEDLKTVKYRTEFIEKIDKNNLGGQPAWLTPFFQSKIDLSAQRAQGDQQAYMEKQKTDSNPYDETGELKQGFQVMFYDEARRKYKGTPNEKYVVSTNPRLNLFQDQGAPNDKDLVFFLDISVAGTSAQLSFDHMKWNSNAFGESVDEATKAQEKIDRKENFKQEYDSFIRSLDRQNLTKPQREKELRAWLNKSLMFEATEEYWENFAGGSGIDFDTFYRTSTSQEDSAEMSRLEKAYKELSLKKQLILKKYKNSNDYKEVDIKSISQIDRITIETIEEDMRRLVRDNSVDADGNPTRTILFFFEKYGIDDLYKVTTNSSSPKMNLAFRELFLEVTGVDFDNAELKDYEMFFKDMGIGRHGGTYANLKRDLKNGTSSNTITDYKDRALELGLDPNNNNDVVKAFFISNSPSWYKRYDANSQYDSFIRDYHSGKIDVEKLVEDYLQSDQDQIYYRNPDTGNTELLTQMQITPSFKFSVPREANIDDLYEDYKNATDDKVKYELLQEMAGTQNVSSEYRTEDMSDILNNPENLKVYIMMMDLRLEILARDKMLKKNFIFMLPQQRKTNYERFESFAKDKNKWDQTKDYVIELMSFRADDYEESYKSHKIPKYGYYRLKPEELTTDVFHSLVWGMSNANLYQQRVKHRGDADMMLRAIENQEFTKGQKPTDTNYYKIAKEMYDFGIYGKTVSKKIEVTIGGRTFDLSKLLLGLRKFGVIQALALSPVVAATNLIGGLTQLTANHIVGRRLHQASNKRALANLIKMLPASIQDVGEFDPEAKINKIMYSFGLHDISQRYQNSKYNKVLRLLPQIGFSMMSMTNFPLEAQTTLSKLMEYRLIDGRFISWRQYMIQEKTKNPSLTNREISDSFESYKNQSMYDFLDDSGSFDQTRLDNAGYKGDIIAEKVAVMGAIRSISELTTMEIASYNEAEGGRNPLASFVLTLKKWMVLSTSMMFSGRRMDLDGEEEGLVYTPKYLYKIFKRAIQDKISFQEAYNELDDVERMNIKTSATLGAMMTVMFTIAMLLKGAADDDDEEDNYLLQLSAYMALRGLNEMGSSNIMLPESYYEAIQNPIMIGSTIKNMTNIFKFGDMGEEVKSGKYKGNDKYWSGIMKATFLKNPYSVSSAEVIGQTRQSYEFFNKSQSLYHIFDLMPASEEEE